VTDIGEVVVSRSDIARLAGVRRPAVTNWQRRHPDFPAAVAAGAGSSEQEVFRAAEVLEWLSGRTVPSNALAAGESAGTTYGDRFRSALLGSRSGGLLSAIDQLVLRDTDRFRGRLRLTDYLRMLLSLVFVQSRRKEHWSAYRASPATARWDLGLPEEYETSHMVEVLRCLDRNPPASREESRQAFDRLLELLRDADARAADEFFTPPSVSRVMARILAARTPAAERLHDPFCRSGELLAGYLDTVAAQGSRAPKQVSGRAPQDSVLRLAEMNVILHGADETSFRPGPARPADGEPADPPESFDAVITNPPFGGRILKAGTRPDYWRYAVTGAMEFDWMQYVLSRLAPGGRAAVLMPAGAAFRSGGERLARAQMVEEGVVECVLALPQQLFERTAIRTQIWFVRPPRGQGERVLFVDGAGLGHMASRTRRSLSDDDVGRLVEAYVSWREASDTGRPHAGVPGLSRSVTPEEIAALDYRMDPSLLVHGDAPMAAGVDPAAAKDRLARLAGELDTLGAQARAADNAVAERLRRYAL
jgi:type I restriction enzyme M protein